MKKSRYGNAPVEDRVRETAVEMHVAIARRAEEPTVGNGAGGEVDRDRDGRRPQPRSYGWVPSPGTWEKPSELPFPSSSSSALRWAMPLGV